MLLFGSALGRWVDCTPSRLRVLVVTIVVNRISVLTSCITWFVILSSTHPAPKQGFFAVALVLGMAEKLSRGANILSIERDWVPTLANTSPDAKNPAPYDLTNLNTTMKRIDMLCKLIAPLAVSTFVSKIKSERIAVIAIAVISTLSFGPECWGVQQVWVQNSRLRAWKHGVDDAAISNKRDHQMPLYGRLALQVMSSVREYVADLGYYFRTSVWIPSLCAAVPHASVLTFSGTMLTYLLNAGYSLNTITGARASGAIFEISSTFLFPWAVGILSTSDRAPRWHNRGIYHLVEQQEPSSNSRLGNTDESESQGTQSGSIVEHSVIKVGYWSLGGLLLSLVSTILTHMNTHGLSKLSSRLMQLEILPDPGSFLPLYPRCAPSYSTQQHCQPR